MLSSQFSVLFPNASTECGSRSKRRTVVCLFGPPDPVETDRIYREQMILDAVHFAEKYQPLVESETEDRTTDDGSSSCEEGRLGQEVEECRRRDENQQRVRRGRVERRTKQRRQSKLTDFYQKTRSNGYAKAERLQKLEDIA